MALEEPAVEQHPPRAEAEEVPAAGDRPGSPEGLIDELRHGPRVYRPPSGASPRVTNVSDTFVTPGGVPQVAWIAFGAALVWAVIYDTFYAMVDREDDLEVGMKSTAILFGDYDRLMVGVFQLLFLSALTLVGLDLDMSMPYYLGLAAGGLLLAYQQFLIADRAPAHCFLAFLNNHWVGALVFAGVIVHYYSL